MVFGSATLAPSGVDEEFMGLLRFAGGTTATIYPGFRASYRTWLESARQRRRAARAQSVPARPARDARARARGDRSSASRSTGSPLLFVREVEDFVAARARRRAAGRQPGGEPRHAPRDARRAPRIRAAASAAARPCGRRRQRSVVSSIDGSADSTVLWRLFQRAGRERSRRAVILPGGPPHTLAFFVNDDMDRAENYDTMDLAMFRAEDIKRSLARRTDWKEDSVDSDSSKRHRTVGVKVGNVTVGGGAPVVVQSMTMTDTADAAATAQQCIELWEAGSEMVRVTVNVPEAAAAVPEIKQRMLDAGCTAPLIGDFHYNGHLLLTRYPDCATALDKYRINPGNVGTGKRRDEQFATICQVAIDHGKPVRIGVNGGSLNQELVMAKMQENTDRNLGKELRRHHQRVHGAVGDPVDRARDRDRPAQGPDHHLVQDVAAACT